MNLVRRHANMLFLLSTMFGLCFAERLDSYYNFYSNHLKVISRKIKQYCSYRSILLVNYDLVGTDLR